MPETDLTRDHKALDDDLAARAYFAKFERIVGLLGAVASEMQRDRTLSPADITALGGYLTGLATSFRALSTKYLIAGRIKGPGARHLTIDFHDSGFPVFQEFMTMLNDTLESTRHLQSLPEVAVLKDDMIRQIVGSLQIPTGLQYALSQRLYFQALAAGGLFWTQNHPVAVWQADLSSGRRQYLLHWAVYDSQTNIPTIYLMDVEDSGRKALPSDVQRWPLVQTHLLAQSMGGLKLVTIARGFDADFVDLHPKRLRRLTLGPMLSAAFTLQTGPVRDILDQALGDSADDWLLHWTMETLDSDREVLEPSGWFGEVPRQVYRLDPEGARGADLGATLSERFMILPERAFQVLAEKHEAAFRGVRKFVVSRSGRILAHG